MKIIKSWCQSGYLIFCQTSSKTRSSRPSRRSFAAPQDEREGRVYSRAIVEGLGEGWGRPLHSAPRGASIEANGGNNIILEEIYYIENVAILFCPRIYLRIKTFIFICNILFINQNFHKNL